MTIEQAAVKTLSRLNLKDELSIDIIDLAIGSIIGFSAARRIIRSDDFPEYKEADLCDLLDEVEKMNINEMVNDFLEGSISNVDKQEEI